MSDPGQRLEDAARKAASRRAAGRDNPEPSLGMRIGQIGILGWMIILPAVLGLVAGRWLDEAFSAGITFTAAFICAGAGLGFWLAFRWMTRS